MNRDGFSLLCMGFTGKKALEWKLKYIDAFNKMKEKRKMSDITLFNQDGRILASSRDIAEKFGKRHDHILRDIESFQKDIPNFGEMFFEDELPDKYGRNQKI